MKNRKAFLLAEETLKIIIAVISLIFLVYFLTQLYFNTKESKELEFAKESLKHLNESLQSKIGEVEIYNPDGWILVSWPHKVLRGSNIPNSCANLGWTSCICICSDTNLLSLDGGDCDNKGVCMENNFAVNNKIDSYVINRLPGYNEVGYNQTKIENPPLKLNIDYENKKINKK